METTRPQAEQLPSFSDLGSVKGLPLTCSAMQVIIHRAGLNICCVTPQHQGSLAFLNHLHGEMLKGSWVWTSVNILPLRTNVCFYSCVPVCTFCGFSVMVLYFPIIQLFSCFYFSIWSLLSRFKHFTHFKCRVFLLCFCVSSVSVCGSWTHEFDFKKCNKQK